jgi:hypothetical protein
VPPDDPLALAEAVDKALTLTPDPVVLDPAAVAAAYIKAYGGA